MRLVLLLCSLVVATIAKNTDAVDLERISRIIGGEKVTEISKWPWLVSISAKVPSMKLGALVLTYRTVYCGASVINSRWILTAAHCVDNARDARYWTVRMATVKLSANVGEKIKDFFGMVFSRDDWRQPEIGVQQIVKHESYDSARHWINDIALFKLKKAIPDFGKVVKEVSLPASNWEFPAPGQQCFMMGWGCTEGGGSVADHARQVVLPIVNDTSCRYMWSVDTISRICAGGLHKQKGICPGDSGGPLVCNNGDHWVQVGIASFTGRDNPGDIFGAFTRVSHYTDWILWNIMQL
ncbi:chymotrypsin-like protease CTRL-1 [Lineus longissimus]|uniref:chymotrypsin-like protease CTRL-1 n=1 Tax=Lineus longissimus TaxID=88925 RepID=UPI002B4E2E85